MARGEPALSGRWRSWLRDTPALAWWTERVIPLLVVAAVVAATTGSTTDHLVVSGVAALLAFVAGLRACSLQRAEFADRAAARSVLAGGRLKGRLRDGGYVEPTERALAGRVVRWELAQGMTRSWNAGGG